MTVSINNSSNHKQNPHQKVYAKQNKDFSAHMISHVLLGMVAALLMALGAR